MNFFKIFFFLFLFTFYPSFSQVESTQKITHFVKNGVIYSFGNTSSNVENTASDNLNDTDNPIIDDSNDSTDSDVIPLPDGVVINETFDTIGDWHLLNGSTVSNGVLNLVTTGSLGGSESNWSAEIDELLLFQSEYALRRFRITFDARQITGNGVLQVSQRYGTFFEQNITNDFQTFSVEFDGNAPNSSNQIIFAGRGIGDTFEIDNIFLEIIGNVDGSPYVPPTPQVAPDDSTPLSHSSNLPNVGGDILINQNFDNSNGWLLFNGSNVSNGVLNLVTTGSNGGSESNWSAQVNNLLNDKYYTTRRYRITFDARQTIGSNVLQVSQRYGTFFEQNITKDFQTFSVEFDGNAANSSNQIIFAGRGIGDVFEIDNVLLEIIGDTSNPNVPNFPAQFYFYTNFESGFYDYTQYAPNGDNPPNFNQWEVDQADPRTTSHSSSPLTSGRNGTGTALWLGAYNSPNGNEYDRNEIGKDVLNPFGEQWLSYSFYVQNTLPDDRIMFQLRNLAPGGSSTVNAISIRQTSDTSKLDLSICTDVNRVDQTDELLGTWNGAGTGTETIKVDYNFRQWNDVVIHYKAAFGSDYTGVDTSHLIDVFGYNPRSDGFIEIWINGVKVVDHVGTTIFRYERRGGEIRLGMTPKIGTYWSSAFTAEGDIYYDNYSTWVGPNGTYDIMNPNR